MSILKLNLTKWILLSAAWGLALGALLQRWLWLCGASGGLLGFVTLFVFDTWRGRLEQRSMRRRFQAEEAEPDGRGS
jgi:hypothetical protein